MPNKITQILLDQFRACGWQTGFHKAGKMNTGCRLSLYLSVCMTLSVRGLVSCSDTRCVHSLAVMSTDVRSGYSVLFPPVLVGEAQRLQDDREYGLGGLGVHRTVSLPSVHETSRSAAKTTTIYMQAHQSQQHRRAPSVRFYDDSGKLDLRM